jgi:hypothetical protein
MAITNQERVGRAIGPLAGKTPVAWWDVAPHSSSIPNAR